MPRKPYTINTKPQSYYDVKMHHMQSVDTTMTVSCSALVSYHIPLFLSVSALVSYHTPPFLSVYCTLLPIIKVYIFPFHISSTHILKPKPRSCLVITNLVFCSAGCPVSPSSLVYHGVPVGLPFSRRHSYLRQDGTGLHCTGSRHCCLT